MGFSQYQSVFFLLIMGSGFFFQFSFGVPSLPFQAMQFMEEPLEGSEAGNLDLVKSRDLARIPSHKHPIPAYYETGPSEHMGTVGIQGNSFLKA